MNFIKDIIMKKTPKDLTVSDNALELIKFFEGSKNKAYQDSVGIWTIGVGHTKTAKRGMVITDEQVMDLLRDDIKEAEDGIKKFVKVSITQYQYDALVSFVFNLGAGALSTSTLLRLLNSGQSNVAKEFLKWNKARNARTRVLEVLAGLTRRRIAESLMYEGKDWKDYEIIFKSLK